MTDKHIRPKQIQKYTRENILVQTQGISGKTWKGKIWSIAILFSFRSKRMNVKHSYDFSLRKVASKFKFDISIQNRSATLCESILQVFGEFYPKREFWKRGEVKHFYGNLLTLLTVQSKTGSSSFMNRKLSYYFLTEKRAY